MNQSIIEAVKQEIALTAHAIVQIRFPVPPDYASPLIERLVMTVQHLEHLEASFGIKPLKQRQKSTDEQALGHVLDALDEAINHHGVDTKDTHEKHVAGVIGASKALSDALKSALDFYAKSENLFEAISEAARFEQIKRINSRVSIIL